MEHKLTDAEIRQIAHFIAQREYNDGNGIQAYLKPFNKAINDLIEYNEKITKK